MLPQGSRIDGRSWQRMRIRSRFQTNLIAISRQGKSFKKRLNHVNLRAGDVLLLQGDLEHIQETVRSLNLYPLVERGLEVKKPRLTYVPISIFAVGILLTACHLLPIQIAFAAVVLTYVLTNITPARKLYASIDWSIIVLLAAMIPIGGALQATGTTKLIADAFISLAGNAEPVYIFALLMIVTMTLSDLMNNAATAIIMAPIAVSIAQSTHSSIDPFLMNVAIGSSCSFLTPISHQNNTIVMGPGGY